MSARRYDPSPARAKAIREARDWAHMSQQDLASVLGVCRWTVRRWEAGTLDPGPETAARIAVVTGTSLSSLLAPSPGWPLERRAA